MAQRVFACQARHAIRRAGLSQLHRRQRHESAGGLMSHKAGVSVGPTGQADNQTSNPHIYAIRHPK